MNDWKRNRPLVKHDFKHFTGDFYNDALSDNLWIDDFEYSKIGVSNTNSKHLGIFIYLTKEKTLFLAGN